MMLKKNIRLVFFIPGRKTGGTNTLFEALIKYIHGVRPEIDIAVVDYKDGYVASSLLNFSDKIKILDWNYDININDNDIMISDFLSAKNLLYKKIKISQSAKLFFWVTHPDDIFKWIPTFNLTLKYSNWLRRLHIDTLHSKYKYRLCSFVNHASKKNSLKFMDNFCIERYKEIFNSPVDNASILPVFTLDNHQLSKKYDNSILNKKNNTINFYWLGRVSDFKTATIIRIAYDLSRFNEGLNSVKAVFHIIGDGKDLEFIKKKFSSINNLIIHYYGTLNISEIRYMFENNSGVMIGHGISILEGARAKYPCIIADGIGFKNKKLLYRRLIDEEKYGVGRIVKNNVDLRGEKLEEIISQILIEDEVGMKEHKRWKEQHSIKSISEDFISNMLDEEFLFSVKDFNSYNLDRGGFFENLIISFKAKRQS